MSPGHQIISGPYLQETLRALLYKGGEFQFARLESLVRQAVKSPPRATIVDSATRPNRKVTPGAQPRLPGRCPTPCRMQSPYTAVGPFVFVMPW